MIVCDSRYCGSAQCERPECVGELAASFVMLLGNIAAYLVDRNKPR